MPSGVIVAMGVFIVLLIAGMAMALALTLSAALGMWPLDFPMLTVIQRFSAGVESFFLLAIPFVALSGGVMDVSGSSRRMTGFYHACIGILSRVSPVPAWGSR